LFDKIKDYVLQQNKNNQSFAFKKYFDLLTFLIKFVLLCHVIACFWIFIGKESYFEIL